MAEGQNTWQNYVKKALIQMGRALAGAALVAIGDHFHLRPAQNHNNVAQDFQRRIPVITGTPGQTPLLARYEAATVEHSRSNPPPPLCTLEGIRAVHMIKDDGSVIHFNNPKVQASLGTNTIAVTGHAENKQISDLNQLGAAGEQGTTSPGILNQLGAEPMMTQRQYRVRSPRQENKDTEMQPGINQLGAESLTHRKKLASNVTGHAENKQITELLPGIKDQPGAESLTHRKKPESNVRSGAVPRIPGPRVSPGFLRGKHHLNYEAEEEEDEEAAMLIRKYKLE